jgi:hypothetical protein
MTQKRNGIECKKDAVSVSGRRRAYSKADVMHDDRLPASILVSIADG